MLKGLTRRVDDLGRVVIPKEYRKVYNISTGDPLEIVATENGDLVLRRTSLSSKLIAAADSVLRAASTVTGKTLMVSDLNMFLHGHGSTAQRLKEKELPYGISKAFREEKILNSTTASDSADFVLDECGYDYFMSAPLKTGLEVRGGIFMFSPEPVTDGEVQLMKVLAAVVSDSLILG